MSVLSMFRRNKKPATNPAGADNDNKPAAPPPPFDLNTGHRANADTSAAYNTALNNVFKLNKEAMAAAESYIEHLDDIEKTEAELSRLMQAYKDAVDTNGDGTLSKAELEAASSNPDAMAKLGQLNQYLNTTRKGSDAQFENYKTKMNAFTSAFVGLSELRAASSAASKAQTSAMRTQRQRLQAQLDRFGIA